jgi:G:T-mismatch repair DNA endonuclease (very short patch repair protein)
MPKKMTTEMFIMKATEIHGNKYDYSKIEYINAKTKVKIICTKHGIFEQLPNSHICNRGCPDCSSKKKVSRMEFIQRSEQVHGNKYDYSKIEYINTRIKVKIICKVHGIFNQLPSHHLQGRGCPVCIYDKKRLTSQQFISRSNMIHDNKYDYSLVDYINIYSKIVIICKKHGKFKQIPGHHLQGHSCQACSNNKRLTSKEFIKNVIEIHGNKYDYSEVIYKNNHTKVNIICPDHGEFTQTPNNHFNGQGCNECNGGIKVTPDQFIEKAIIIHDDKYDYTLTEYKNSKIKVTIICPIHGEFEQTPDSHLQGSGCPKCIHQVSKPELEICTFLDEYDIDYEQSNRSILNGKELDIVIPSNMLAIEFNGLYWHSEQILKNKNPTKYHRQKYVNCKKEGYQLISIFEPEWLFQKDIVKSIILAKLNIYKEKIGARKCELKEIVATIARKFFEENHIQGFSGGKHIGLFHEDQLVSAISFRKNLQNYELTRFVNKKNTLVHGAFSKLLKYFINNNSFESIFTFADLRYFEGQVYEKNGFKFDHEVAPSYYYFKGLELLHKRNFQHKRLKEKFKNYDPKFTEYQNCLDNGYDRIWDCGKLKFEYR